MAKAKHSVKEVQSRSLLMPTPLSYAKVFLPADNQGLKKCRLQQGAEFLEMLPGVHFVAIMAAHVLHQTAFFEAFVRAVGGLENLPQFQGATILRAQNEAEKLMSLMTAPVMRTKDELGKDVILVKREESGYFAIFYPKGAAAQPRDLAQKYLRFASSRSNSQMDIVGEKDRFQNLLGFVKKHLSAA